MSNELALFDNKQVAVPDHVAALAGDSGNIDAGSNVPSLSIRGKIFRTQIEGEETMVTRYDEEVGDEVPVSALSLIVVDQGPFGARVYYGAEYDPESTSGPKCFSLDGKHPDAKSPEPQAKSCAQCPHAVKGSKVSPSGTATTACQLQRRLAVVPAKKPDSTPLLLRLAPTSAYDPETKDADNGWFGWRQYLDFLNARGVRHTAQVVTKARFDADAEHPKLLFRPERFLTEEEAKIIAEQMQSEEVDQLLHPQEAPAEPAAEPVPGEAILGESADGEEAPEEKPAPKKSAAKKAAPEKQAEEPEEKPAPKKTRKKAPDPEQVPEDDGDEVPWEDEKPARRTAEGSGESGAEPSGVDALLDDWDA